MISSLWSSSSVSKSPKGRSKSYPYSITPVKHYTHFVFIMNPVAGYGTGLKVMEEVERVFLKENIKVTVHKTLKKGHARELGGTIILDEGIGGIVVVGGNGTFSEVINGLLNDRTDGAMVPVGIIPTGYNNSLAYELWGPPLSHLDIAYEITKRPIVNKNFPRIIYTEDNNLKFYYLCCFFTCGFLPNAIDKAEEWRWTGSFKFHLGFIEEILSNHHPSTMYITVDDKLLIDEPITLFLGGRSISRPQSDSQDSTNSLPFTPLAAVSEVHMTFVVFNTSVTALDLLQNLQGIITNEGGIIQQPAAGGVHWYRGKICDIKGGKEGISVDGEVGVLKNTPLRVEADGKVVTLFGYYHH